MNTIKQQEDKMFILTKDFDELNPRDLPLLDSRYKEYRKYLDSIREELPKSASNFALADWRLNPANHRCPHDSWVEYIKIYEVSSGERQENRIIEIEVKLLGAYHDGYLQLNYKNAFKYSLSKSDSSENPEEWLYNHENHGDWLYDEIRLSEKGLVLHEIEFRHKADWIIECEDIEVNWIAIEK